MNDHAARGARRSAAGGAGAGCGLTRLAEWRVHRRPASAAVLCRGGPGRIGVLDVRGGSFGERDGPGRA